MTVNASVRSTAVGIRSIPRMLICLAAMLEGRNHFHDALYSLDIITR